MSKDSNNWNRPYKRPRLNRRPPGLKGKEIGQFYRNQQLQKKLYGRQKKEFSITFTMPPAITSAVKKDIHAIIKIAEEENITLPKLKLYSSSVDEISIKTEPVDKREQSNDGAAVKAEPMASTSSMVDCSIVKSEPLDNISKTDQSTIKSEPPDDTSIKSGGAVVKLEPMNRSDESQSLGAVDSGRIKTEEAIVKLEPKDKSDDSESLGAADNRRIKTEEAVVKLEPEDKSDDSKSMQGASKDINMSFSSTFDDSMPSTSTADYSNFGSLISKIEAPDRLLDLRYASTYKYGYEDIITGTFDEKLEERLATGGIDIAKKSHVNDELCATFHNDYKIMKNRSQYKEMLNFREMLPTYKVSKKILEIVSKNQVLVISGETGCGKSTQVPQIILDDAIRNNRGAYVKILVTEPRRIAASSLAMRVAQERAERLGESVGFAVRLERVSERPRGSIQYCTTGILLTDLEVNQSLGNFSHIILDEVHERDCHIDLAMFMLKKVLKKRKDLKVILMSATIDSDSLAAYFDDCHKMHIEGLAYPVQDLYLEDVLKITEFVLPTEEEEIQQNMFRQQQYGRRVRHEKIGKRYYEKRQDYLEEIGEWLRSKRHELDPAVYRTLKNPKIEELNYNLIAELIDYICRGEPGAILVFLPGFNEISKMLQFLNHLPLSRYRIYSLHSKLPTLEQHMIFERPPSGVRKIIVATNIAETSITIDDVVYVIDCCRHKVTGLNVDTNIETLDVKYISKANLRQRRGRAGRCQPGICYHLATSFRAEQFEERTPPELQRSNLLEPVLMIKRLRLGLACDGLKNVPSPPAERSILWAISHLQKCGALRQDEKLTPLGWHLARLPLHPAAGKLLLLAALCGCLDRAASVAAVWGFKDPFLLIVGKEKEIEKRKREFTLGEPSDHLAVAEAIVSFERTPQRYRRKYCYENFLSYNTLELLCDMKKQLGGNLKSMGFLPSGNIKSDWENRNANNLSLFKAIVAAALYPNIATVRWAGIQSRNPNKHVTVQARTPEEGKVCLHPSSVMAGNQATRKSVTRDRVLNRLGANWLVYWLKRRSTHLFILDVTLIYTLPLLFFGDFVMSKSSDSHDECILEVSSIKVRVMRETADLLYDLRALLDHVLASKVMSSSNNSTRTSKFEELVLSTVIELITAEDDQAEYVGPDLSDSEVSDVEISEFETDFSYSGY